MKTVFLALLMAKSFFSHAQTNTPNDYQLLPENLAFFTASRTGNLVSLEWQTLNEQSSRGFSVQRKTAGEWETVSFIATRAMNGNSSVKQSYAYADANEFKGISQYRVIEVTNDAKQRRSEIRAVKGESQTEKVMLYPNPSADGRINLVFDNAAAKKVLIIDAFGRVTRQFGHVTNTTFSIDNLQPGFYTVCIANLSSSESVVLRAVVANR